MGIISTCGVFIACIVAVITFLLLITFKAMMGIVEGFVDSLVKVIDKGIIIGLVLFALSIIHGFIASPGELIQIIIYAVLFIIVVAVLLSTVGTIILSIVVAVLSMVFEIIVYALSAVYVISEVLFNWSMKVITSNIGR